MIKRHRRSVLETFTSILDLTYTQKLLNGIFVFQLSPKGHHVYAHVRTAGIFFITHREIFSKSY